jgi:FixJ family two-component response regulator
VNATHPIVAVVDDDPRLLESLGELLESAGYAPRCFTSARALLDRGLLDVAALITDIGMPGMDGFELRDLVLRSYPNLPVFLVTGRHEIADQVRAQGVRGFFRKPFDAQRLLVAVDNALRTRDQGG